MSHRQLVYAGFILVSLVSINVVIVFFRPVIDGTLREQVKKEHGLGTVKGFPQHSDDLDLVPVGEVLFLPMNEISDCLNDQSIDHIVVGSRRKELLVHRRNFQKARDSLSLAQSNKEFANLLIYELNGVE